MKCELFGNKQKIMEKLYHMKTERLKLFKENRSDELKEFDKNLNWYVYCDGVRHIRANGVDVDTVIGKCGEHRYNQNIEKAEVKISGETKNNFTFENFPGDKKNINEIKKFYNDPSFLNCIISGGLGTFKTSLCRSLEFYLLSIEKTVVFIHAKKLEKVFLDMQSGNRNFSNKNTAQDKYDEIEKANILIIDDLGTEKFGSEHFISEFLSLLETKRGRLIFTTNLRFTNNADFPQKQNKQGFLNYRYSTRIISRILEKRYEINLVGKDFRLN